KRKRLLAETEAEMRRINAEAKAQEILSQAESAKAYEDHPALLRIRELETLMKLGSNSNARIYIGADKIASLASNCHSSE
ncbi:MAG: hypothetical protein K2Z81_27540, partial [Cyanobacteria bacterium]|nr:hypothetical protein [Cyanobacteriota bacterium]